jgi:hypothetical protein
MTTRLTCINCKYYQDNKGYYKDKGECRRNSPVVIAGIGTKWPIVNRTDWCGDLTEESK